MRLSGLQKEVLALYRQCLRECRKKPQSTRAHFEKFVRDEFARSLAIDKRDFAAVEFLLRKGHRQLDVYSSPGIKDIRYLKFEAAVAVYLGEEKLYAASSLDLLHPAPVAPGFPVALPSAVTLSI